MTNPIRAARQPRAPLVKDLLKETFTMRLLNSLRRRAGLLAIALVLLCGSLITVSLLRASAEKQERGQSFRANPAGLRHNLNERVRKGLGTEVRFATPRDSADQVNASVESAARFIHERSNLQMSEETMKRLARAERDTLKGKTPRLSLDELADTFAGTVTDRVSTMTDDEIERTANILSSPSGEINSRASGKWGTLTRAEFVSQIKAAREWSQRGDQAVRNAARTLIGEEVNDRANYLSEAMPEQFGRVKEEGVTPLQAVVIGYSVAADDLMTDSRSETAKTIVQERMSARLTRAEAKAQKRDSNTPYGANGFFHSTPLNLVFNKTAVNKLLERAEGGKK
jgi:hypothetical protein